MDDSENRSKRRTRKAIDYSKEQEFSDDAFEDEATAQAMVSPVSSARKARASTGRRKKKKGEDEDDDMSLEFSSAGALLASYQQPATGPRYVEKGYPSDLPPIRERFLFVPEFEEDGSPRVELILGRRPIQDEEKVLDDEEIDDDSKADISNGEADDTEKEDKDESSDEDDDDSAVANGSTRKRRCTQGRKSGKTEMPAKKKSKKSVSPTKPTKSPNSLLPKATEYEYLIKYKGRSYLHLDWKTASDLESMNKSAKTLYRRFLKKLEAGTDENLEDTTVDPSYIEAEKIVDEKDEEILMELSDKELLEWEKEREKEIAAEDEALQESGDADGSDGEEMDAPALEVDATLQSDHEPDTQSDEKESESALTPICDQIHNVNQDDEEEEKKTEDDIVLDIEKPITDIEVIRKIIAKDGPYYPVVEGSNNPYRDGYITEPPKKPRASYLFFQTVYRSEYNRRFPEKSQSEVMTLLGDTWRAYSESEQAPYIQLAQEETAQFEKEKQMLEKAQRPNELWQPLRRCKQVLERLRADSFAQIFLEPVDTKIFTDYNMYVDRPMDLGTIKKNLETKKYQMPENFARDVRRVWQNCKIYNQHGSAIWFVADYMSKQFERLYHAWVLAFRNRYLRWAHPKARPWEITCRECEKTCESDEAKIIMCDHCDATYGMNCLKPPMKEAPSGPWHCPECINLVAHNDRVRMLSALSEQAAKRRAELGDVPRKKVKRKMFLVKWAGLGYEFCTWETKDDINDDALISAYRKLNGMSPDEPDLSQQLVEETLNKALHISPDTEQGVACMPELKTQLYAQTRAIQFTRFGSSIPPLLSNECGPFTKSIVNCKEQQDGVRLAVAERLNDLVFMVSRGETRADLMFSGMSLPLHGEYDSVVPITQKGLMMNVGEINGSVAFLGYRQFPDGSKGPSEINNLVRGIGDKIIAVDGMSTAGKSFKEVIELLRESGKNKFCYMRFYESKLRIGDTQLTSTGDLGRNVFNELTKKIKLGRRKIIAQRKAKLESVGAKEEKNDDSDRSVGSMDSDSSDSYVSLSDDDLEAEDRQLIRKVQKANKGPDSKSQPRSVSSDSPESPQKIAKDPIAETEGSPEIKRSPTVESNKSIEKSEKTIISRETTRSLARSILDIDVGYSSDEGGDDDRAWFLDGVDSTFLTIMQAKVHGKGEIVSDSEESVAVKEEESKKKSSEESKELNEILIKRNEFVPLGNKAKLFAAVISSNKEPDHADFDNFPMPSSRALALIKEEEEKIKAEKEAEKAELSSVSPVKLSGVKSTTKVEQVSVETNETLRVWASVSDAAATLQISQSDIQAVLSGEYNEEIGDEAGGYKWRYADENAEVTAKVPMKGRSKKGREAYLEFRDKLYDHAKPHEYKGGHKLRDYQIDGVNWLASCWYKRVGCILADEMGLGKTVQIVTYIDHLFRVEKLRGPFLIVVPLSTVEHWRREVEGWTDLRCCVYHDRQREWRDVMREYEWYYKDRPHTSEYLKYDVLVTTYDTLIADFDVVGNVPWRVAVVDEAHRLRNVKGKLLECMKQISQKGTLQYGYQSRVLMTGTPLQNNTQELWTLLNFIEPFKFPSLDEFMRKFGNMANQEQVQNLQNAIAPFMLRRVKEDVAKDIPSKEETLIDVELTSIQKQYYRAIFEHNHTFLNMGASRTNAPKLMNIQMELRKCCNHPFLLDGVEQRELEKQHTEFLQSGVLNGLTPEEQHNIVHETGYIKSSGKMVLLDKLLPKLRSEGHKVLIFSQMVKMLDLISEFCDFRGFKHERLDGSIRGNERQKAIDRYNTEKDSFVFLLSTRAGGVGINLTAADICIIFDSDWNPQNDVQAQARCHRIGQTRDVMIYRLITSKTFEQEMFDRASKKLGLEQAVLGTFGQEDEDGKPTTQEMEQLLKKGAYALMDEDDEGKQFCEDDIESILAKRTRTRVVEGAKTSSWLNKQGLNVTKSKFTAEGADAGVDLNDPMFWQKIMPNFVTPQLLWNKLNEMVESFDSRMTGIVKPKGVGRGRGRWAKKKAEEQAAAKLLNGDAHSEEIVLKEESPPPPEIEPVTSPKGPLITGPTKGDVKKVRQFMADLESCLEDAFDQMEDDTLPQSEKALLQKLLLTVSLKEKLFNTEQRATAKAHLSRLEGDRRRRCRTSDGANMKRRGRGGAEEIAPEVALVNQALLIQSSKKKRKKRRDKLFALDEEDEKLVVETESEPEDDWSEDDATGKKRKGISLKEAKRRKAWGSGKDQTKAAGRAWPAIPRHVMKNVLSDMLDEVIKIDKDKDGLFSQPVPKDSFPDYYDIIKEPMDYGTIKKKLDHGEYRSAQQMQRDFLLVMQNCIKYNSTESEIVKEARTQALAMPGLLREAGFKNNLFIGEDGTVLEIIPDEEEEKTPEKKGPGRGRKKGSKNKPKVPKDGDDSIQRKRRKRKKDDSDVSDTEEVKRKKPRIRISLNPKPVAEEEADSDDSDVPVAHVAKSKRRGKMKIGKKSLVENIETPVKEEGTKKKRGRKPKKLLENVKEESDIEPKRTRSPGPTIPRKKRTAMNPPEVVEQESDVEDENKEEGEIDEVAEAERVDEEEGEINESDDAGAVHLDKAALKEAQGELDGSFSDARDYFTRRGAWTIPSSLEEWQVKEVSKILLAKMKKLDQYNLFAHPVKDSEAPGYSDTVTDPMDFGTIKANVEKGQYGHGSDVVKGMYNDILLTMDNCALYNEEDSEVAQEAARIMSLLPETFANACLAITSGTKKKGKRSSN